MASEHASDVKHFKKVEIPALGKRVLELEDKIEEAQELLALMPNDHKNCSVENYEQIRSQLRGILTL